MRGASSARAVGESIQPTITETTATAPRRWTHHMALSERVVWCGLPIYLVARANGSQHQERGNVPPG